jgi:hypothetical protein
MEQRATTLASSVCSFAVLTRFGTVGQNVTLAVVENAALLRLFKMRF